MHALPEPDAAAPRIDRLSPEALVRPFAESRILGWFLVALAAHAVVIAAFSLGTIRDLVDPEGAAARKAAAAAAAANPAPDAAAPVATTPPAAAPANPPAGEAPAATPATPATPAADKPSPVEQATTEAAKPDEIPQAPDDLGLSIEDTNPK